MKNRIKALLRIRCAARLAVGVLALAVLGIASTAWAAIAVTNLDDSGPGSLRQAIADAVPGDTITFMVYGTITLTSGALTLEKDLRIEGPGSYRLRISGNHTSRVFVIRPNMRVTLAGMTISDGLADGNSPYLPSAGGGILVGAPPMNFATSLTLSEVVISGNQALGDTVNGPWSYPGLAVGGGIANLGTLAITDGLFIGNLARGADGSTSPALPAGLGLGGGIYSRGKLMVIESRFTHNQAIGGNDNSSPSFPGLALGGAIYGEGPTADLAVQDGEFDHNQAIGGNGNESAAAYPNQAGGGAICIAAGQAAISNCTLQHNMSAGGAGAAEANGGIGGGGAVLASNSKGQNTNVTISDSKIEHNMTLGGPGSAGRDGGEGQGGGLNSTAGATLTVVNTTVAHNHAQGGGGGMGGNGGDGLGGGLYDGNDLVSPPIPPTATKLVLRNAIVTKNLALYGEAGAGGSDGEGIGGGVYYLGSFSNDAKTAIRKNQASTGNDNVGP